MRTAWYPAFWPAFAMFGMVASESACAAPCGQSAVLRWIRGLGTATVAKVRCDQVQLAAFEMEAANALASIGFSSVETLRLIRTYQQDVSIHCLPSPGEIVSKAYSANGRKLGIAPARARQRLLDAVATLKRRYSIYVSRELCSDCDAKDFWKRRCEVALSFTDA